MAERGDSTRRLKLILGSVLKIFGMDLPARSNTARSVSASGIAGYKGGAMKQLASLAISLAALSVGASPVHADQATENHASYL
jgi:hypothetical protein